MRLLKQVTQCPFHTIPQGHSPQKASWQSRGRPRVPHTLASPSTGNRVLLGWQACCLRYCHRLSQGDQEQST